MQKVTLASSAVLFALTATVGAQTPAPVPTTVRKITIGGEGGWDYLTADAASKRLYVSRGNHIIVLDTETEKVVGELAGTPGVHGVAIVPDLGKGFTSNGGDDTVTAFDLKTFKETGRVKVGGRPDWIMFEPTTNRVFTFNHGSKDATAVDPSGVTVAGTVALEGVPEAAVADGKGHVFVNIMDKNEVVEFDAQSLRAANRWSLAPGQRPTGLAIDREHRRLFSTCGGSQTMVVLDADSGHVLATLPIGPGCDGCAFDPGRGLAYSSNGGDGTLTVVHEGKPGQFGVVATIPTQQSARTIALDPQSHRIYLAAATSAPAPAAAAKTETKTAPAGATKGAGRRRNMVPGSFAILVVGD
jgi:DNA-binding beta-propeller fold protein YncE